MRDASGQLTLARVGLSLALFAICTLTLGCAARSTFGVAQVSPLSAGLYEVVDRFCDMPRDTREDACFQTRYVELVRGTFHGVRPDQMALVLWLAEPSADADYTYSAGPLRGHFIKPDEYLVNESPGSREWLLVDAGAIRELRHERFPESAKRERIESARLVLRAVERTPRLAQKIPYPQPAP